MRKQDVLVGKEPDSALPSIKAGIASAVKDLQRLGVRLEASEILARLEVDAATDLLRIRGQISQVPPGNAFIGQKLRFLATLDYVPPGRLVKYGWRWKPRGGGQEYLTHRFERSSENDVDLGTGFWWGADQVRAAGGLEMIAYVYLGDEENEAARLSSGIVEMTARPPRVLSLRASPQVVVKDAATTVEIADWAPTPADHWIDWDVDGKRVADNYFVLTRRFEVVGPHTVVAHLYGRGDTLLASRGEHVADATTVITVQDPMESAEVMLGAMDLDGAPPSVARLETTLLASISETESRIADGGEQREYWVARLKAQRRRLESLRRSVPDIATTQPLPMEPTTAVASRSSTGPVKAALILPGGGGSQPLAIYLRTWHESGAWKARLIDMTSSDVYSREGSGNTPVLAEDAAVAGWMASHPYPRGAKVRYRPPSTDWSLPTDFNCKDTPWDVAKAWVDGILTIGGVVVGGLLLLTPEPTGATKALGYVFVAASIARSGVAIYENLRIGIDPLDGRNVVEGLSIVTSGLGMGGTLLRQYGIRATSTVMYRVGSFTVMAALGGDVGTLAFVGGDAIAQLRTVQADPTKDDGEKCVEWLRVAAQLFLSGAMFFVTNKDLLKSGLHLSDFVRTEPRRSVGAGGSLSTGARLDLALELKRVGDLHTGQRVAAGTISDGELLDRHALLAWLKSGAPTDVAELGRRLSPRGMEAVQDMDLATIRAALDDFADDALFDRLAIRAGSGSSMVDISSGWAKITSALARHPEAVATMRRVADLEAAGNVSGLREWVAQTEERLVLGRVATAHEVKGTVELVGELGAMEALAKEIVDSPSLVVRFTPAPPAAPGGRRRPSFDIAVGPRATSAEPAVRLVEVETITDPITKSKDLHRGVAHAAEKLPLDRPKPVKNGQKTATILPGETLPTASKEAAVVVTQWPPRPTGRGTRYEADGSSVLTRADGTLKKGHIAEDLVRELNGQGLDRAGAQFLDRVTVVDGNGQKVFSLVNEPAGATSVDGSRHRWKVDR